MVCNKKKIAFVCGSQNLTPYSEFIPLALFLEKHNYSCLFVLERYANPTIIEKLNSAGINHNLRGKILAKSKNNNYKKKKNKIILKNNLIYRLLILIKQMFDLYKKFKYFTKTDKYINQIFSEKDPSILILYGDRVLGLVPSAIKWMKKRGMPVLDIQIAVSDKKFLYNSFRKNNYYYNIDNTLNRFFGRIFPSYKESFNSECVLFYPWSTILALHVKQMLPANPWYIGQSWADRAFFINELSKKENTNKLSNLKNKVIGQYSIDLLYNSHQNRLVTRNLLIRKYFNLEKTTKKVLIFAAPQFYEHNIYDHKTSLNEINYLVQELIKLDNLLVFISLHPKMAYSDYSYINQKSENIRVLKDERLSSVLPIGEFFIGAFESTFTWAMLCNVIPIFLDYYNLGFDLTKYESVNISSEKQNFKNDLKFIISNENTCFNNLSKDKDKLPPFDGKCGDRFISEINSITS